MATAAANSFEFEGKEFTLWTEKQLEGVNRKTLETRAMNLRDHVGQDRLPQMPRHPEGLALWILSVQNALTGGGKPAPMEVGDDYAPMGGGGGRGVPPADAEPLRPMTPSSDAAQAYVDAKKGSEAARVRNQGGGMADVFRGS